ncbi:hypothetical protein ACFY3U_05180 [Micromonospora sp. NPDC000089]|uniref:hypothetical protein n=1 Tax=unclassified Micromonospora TaxID=2617518 RepID=UPI0036BB7FDB
MDLNSYVESLRRELVDAAELGGADARSLAGRLTGPMESAFRLALLEALSGAAAEITRDLAPGSVEVRLRGREPYFVVTPPPAEPQPDTTEPADVPVTAPEAEDGPVSRISLRLPDQLKGRVEEAANRDGLSVNAWLVRAVTAAVQSGSPTRPTTLAPRSAQHFTGWVR